MASGRARTWLRELRPPPLLLLLLLLGPWPAAGHGGKYSREKNEPEPSSKREPGGEFRMEKLNQLWEKAQRLDLPPLKLSELHADLKIQERDEFKWKKLKAEGLDEDGEKEAKLARGLSVILAKYGLDGRKDARAVSSNSISHGPADHSLEDPRLEKLWHKAKTSGKFSSEELDKLWRELQHHKEKVHEYNVLLETLSRTEEIHENVISPVDVSRVKEDALQVGHAELKDKLRDISQGFDRLRRVSHQGYGDQAELQGQAAPEPQRGTVGRGTRSLSLTPHPRALLLARARAPAPGQQRLDQGLLRASPRPHPAGPGNCRLNVCGRCARSASRGRLHCARAPCTVQVACVALRVPGCRRAGHRACLCSFTGFEEPRVLDLWDMAQSANFTEKELEAFREELKHFEAKIEKHNHYQKQLEISHQKLKHVESLGDQEHVSRNRERYAVLEEKTKELGYKVKKHLQDLSSRISRARHNEL